jgi:phosphoribosylaminoimidazole carboxylase (NCAIR synthetase)
MIVKGNLLILGAGRHQVPLIVAAESLGFKVVIADNNSNAPGRQYSTFQTFASSTDFHMCKKVAEDYDVVGVTTSGTDQPISVMAGIAHDLSLPCYISKSGAEIATSKLTQRNKFQAAGIKQPMFVEGEMLSTRRSAWNRYPCIVKPDRSQGQRGIRLVGSSGDLDGAIKNAKDSSNNGRVIVEEFVEGPELTVNAWFTNGNITFFAVSDRITYSKGCMGVCFQHIFPSVAAMGHDSLLREIAIAVSQVYGIENGPLYIQMIACCDGFSLIEAAARVGGGHENLLFPQIYGFDPSLGLLELAVGRSLPNNTTRTRGTGSGLINFIFADSGLIQSVSKPSFDSFPNISNFGFYLNPGDELPGMHDGQGRAGFFIVADAARDELCCQATEFYNQLELSSPEGKNLIFHPSPRDLLSP